MRRFVPHAAPTARRHCQWLARCVLAWFVLSIGVAVASPLVSPQSFELICSGSGAIKLLVKTDDGAQEPLAGHGLELANGLFLRNELGIALRRSVSNYKTGNLVDSLLGDVLDNNQPIPFEPYNALYGKVRLEYTPFQQYRRRCRQSGRRRQWPAAYRW